MIAAGLPALREDLQLQPGPSDLNGAPTWSIYDPVRNRYIRLSAFGFEILRQWHLGSQDAIMDQVEKCAGRRPKEDEIKGLVDVLQQNQLFHKTGADGVEELAKIASMMKVDWYKKIVHQYLFFKIPLIHPDRFLQRTKHRLQYFYQPSFYMMIGVIGLAGLFLLLRDWTHFTTETPDLFSWETAIWGAAALVLSKLVHEFAHAYTAARLNCRVASMGVAFMVMIPMLYSELSDTWRLVRRKDRLSVAGAGVIAELVLALLATFAWCLLPDSGIRDGAFMLATVTWVMTLAINLNPFMRFDGYYLFADALGVENLQDRSFGLAKWALREWFLGIGAPMPERLKPSKRRLLIAYAFATWIYRFFLFLGIAVLVYYMFFKLLGVILFVVELGYFIALPIWKEVKVWWSLRENVNMSKPAIRSLLILLAVVLFLSVPWQQHVNAPAVLRAGGFSLLFPSKPGQLVDHSLEDGRRVEKGDVLFILSSPELDYEIGQSEQRIAAKEVLLRRFGTRQEDTNRWHILKQEIAEEQTRLDGLTALREKLTVRAPHAGTIRDVETNLTTGRWLAETQLMARLVKTDQLEVLAYVSEHAYHRIRSDEPALFVANDFFADSVPLNVMDMAKVNTAYVEHPGLIEKFGGNLSAREIGKNTFMPTEAVYKVRLSPQDDINDLPTIRFGTVSLPASRESIIGRFVETVGAVLIRESGF
ncbi:HlyD family efflux transporter periplasmic adaptor subunit [Terasakiella sp. A23]|uniref:HlyD family efflux transporter periplasmic adaptor subunit n=1 Tax=Terasakiella sp. FCG-A23 TaxID=3080561 RepID=UPI002955D988|nr:HlyD family efflux transporter periplasmic adaptor subunit [Terasakiella sp. A23]MDV7340342.1 HlyD family efflux transporter periplasmic adaptor subunit [Terasakiella sp. A23]